MNCVAGSAAVAAVTVTVALVKWSAFENLMLLYSHGEMVALADLMGIYRRKNTRFFLAVVYQMFTVCITYR